jgi:predicted metalloendopeptidase
LRQRTDADALAILKEAATNLTNQIQIKENLYKSILDTVGRNKMGIAPLKPFLKKIDAVKNAKDLEALLIEWNLLAELDLWVLA